MSGESTRRGRGRTKGYSNIVIGYDGSDNGKRALEKAISITKDSGGELTIIIVADTINYAAYSMGEAYARLREDMLDYAKKLIAESSDTAKQSGLSSVKASVEEGHPGDLIVREASKRKADLVVVGRRGIRGVQRILMGSVSSSVVSHSECDVLVVK